MGDASGLLRTNMYSFAQGDGGLLYGCWACKKAQNEPTQWRLEGCSGHHSISGPSSNLVAPVLWLSFTFVSSTGLSPHLQLLLTSCLLYSPLSFTLCISSRLLLQGTCLLASLGSLKPWFFQLFSFYGSDSNIPRRRSCLENRLKKFFFWLKHRVLFNHL